MYDFIHPLKIFIECLIQGRHSSKENRQPYCHGVYILVGGDRQTNKYVVSMMVISAMEKNKAGK